MKKTTMFLNTLAIFISGMIISSLWITKTNNWKLYLPICLACIILSQSINNCKDR